MFIDKKLVVPFTIAVITYCLLCFYVPLKYKDLPLKLSETVEFIIPLGTSAHDAARIIVNSKATDNVSAVTRAMILQKTDRNIIPGVYKVYKGSPSSVIRQMKTNKPQQAKVTLVPGMRYKQIAALCDSLSEEGAFEKAILDDKNFYSEVRKFIPDNKNTRLAFLFPDTYFTVPCKQAAENFVRHASYQWYDKIGKSIISNNSPHELNQLAILASLLENEAVVADEHALISGVFMNRIKNNMPLQCDATVTFAWEEKNGIRKKNLIYSDLKIDSPYNTYKYKGLPPAAICCPSLSAWRGAVSPQSTDYIYFFADGSGKHIFSKTYNEHITLQKEKKSR